MIIDRVNFTALSDAARTRMRKSKIGFVFQKFNLLPTLDARSNIEVAIDIAGNNGDRDPAYLSQIVELLGISKRLDHRPSELSGGEQQRVALARALVNRPAIVLADEPTGNLDSANAKEIISLLKLSNQRYHQTLILVTHDHDIALQADRIITFGDGHIVRDEAVRA